MWLSRLPLDPLRPEHARWLADPYRLHQLVMTGFNGGRQANGVLFRVETDRKQRHVPVLIQSVTEPDWSATEPRPECKPFDLDLAAGRQLRFRLRANPVKRLPAGRDDPLAGKRVALLREEEQLAWLAARAEPSGVRWLAVRTVPRGTQAGRKGGLRLSHHGVDFDGHLEVIDPTRLVAAVTAGLGPAKAFGFGLLSLAPA